MADRINATCRSLLPAHHAPAGSHPPAAAPSWCRGRDLTERHAGSLAVPRPCVRRGHAPLVRWRRARQAAGPVGRRPPSLPCAVHFPTLALSPYAPQRVRRRFASAAAPTARRSPDLGSCPLGRDVDCASGGTMQEADRRRIKGCDVVRRQRNPIDDYPTPARSTSLARELPLRRGGSPIPRRWQLRVSLKTAPLAAATPWGSPMSTPPLSRGVAAVAPAESGCTRSRGTRPAMASGAASFTVLRRGESREALHRPSHLQVLCRPPPPGVCCRYVRSLVVSTIGLWAFGAPFSESSTAQLIVRLQCAAVITVVQVKKGSCSESPFAQLIVRL